MRKRKVKIILCLLFILAIVTSSFFIGYRVAYNKIENTFTDTKSETFYATITDINDTSISVQGVEINDINYRGEFEFAITGETELVWRGTPITVSEFNVGDCISITFTGYIQETYPAQITDVIKVQLLNDEK